MVKSQSNNLPGFPGYKSQFSLILSNELLGILKQALYMEQKSFLLSFILCVRSCGFAMGDLKKHNLSEKYIYKKMEGHGEKCN